ncbi:hypothetical protein YC2023_103014 [Brassica napus]
MNQRLSRILDERSFSESTIIEIYPAIFSFYHFLLFGFVDQVQHPFICYGLKSTSTGKKNQHGRKRSNSSRAFLSSSRTLRTRFFDVRSIDEIVIALTLVNEPDLVCSVSLFF